MLDMSLVCLWGVVFLIYEEFTFSQSLGSLNLIEDVMKIHINCFIKCSGSSLLFFFFFAVLMQMESSLLLIFSVMSQLSSWEIKL